MIPWVSLFFYLLKLGLVLSLFCPVWVYEKNSRRNEIIEFEAPFSSVCLLSWDRKSSPNSSHASCCPFEFCITWNRPHIHSFPLLFPSLFFFLWVRLTRNEWKRERHTNLPQVNEWTMFSILGFVDSLDCRCPSSSCLVSPFCFPRFASTLNWTVTSFSLCKEWETLFSFMLSRNFSLFSWMSFETPFRPEKEVLLFRYCRSCSCCICHFLPAWKITFLPPPSVVADNLLLLLVLVVIPLLRCLGHRCRGEGSLSCVSHEYHEMFLSFCLPWKFPCQAAVMCVASVHSLDVCHGSLNQTDQVMNMMKRKTKTRVTETKGRDCFLYYSSGGSMSWMNE